MATSRRQRAAMAQELNVVTPGTHQRRGLGRVEDSGICANASTARPCIPDNAVVTDAANLPGSRSSRNPATAGETSAVLPPCQPIQPAAFSAISRRAEFIDHSGHLGSGDARVRNGGKRPSFVITSL